MICIYKHTKISKAVRFGKMNLQGLILRGFKQTTKAQNPFFINCVKLIIFTANKKQSQTSAQANLTPFNSSKKYLLRLHIFKAIIFLVGYLDNTAVLKAVRERKKLIATLKIVRPGL